MKTTCLRCEAVFEVTESDMVFLKKISPEIQGKVLRIPPPKLCPDCRAQRRLAFRNERKLYSRKCGLCKKNMVTIYSSDKPYVTYCNDCWWGDQWSPLDYGHEFDFTRPFFEQFEDLMKTVPLIGLWNGRAENAEFNNNCFSLKNSYMCFNTDFGQNNYYCYISEYNDDVVDCAYMHKSQLSYECLDSRNIYHCFFSRELENSQDCYFSSDLIGCKNCFGCHGLRHKEYYMFNKPVTPQEWEQKVKKMIFSHANILEFKKLSAEVSAKVPQINLKLIQCENCEGDHLYGCKNAKNSFDVHDAEDISNVVYGVMEIKNVQDAFALGGVEWSYELLGGGMNVSKTAFINNTLSGLSDSYYSQLCSNSCSYVFGSVSLKKQQYCILNKGLHYHSGYFYSIFMHIISNVNIPLKMVET